MTSLPRLRGALLARHTHGFHAAAWSPDGTRLAGIARTATTTEDGIVIYSIGTSTYERVTNSGSPVAWLPGGRRVLYRDKNSLMTVDVETKKAQPVLDKLGVGVNSLALARDGRTLLAVRNDNQADIWIIGAPDPTADTPSGPATRP